MQAFVLMSFSGDFEAVYDDLIVPGLADNNFSVSRADLSDNQQQILKDIITRLHAADLVIVDVTGLNGNVMYELGLAHGMGKRTMMITQHIEELPFDLRPYRATEYTVNFNGAAKLTEAISAVAKAIQDGTAEFSNPIQDFAPDSLATATQVAQGPLSPQVRREPSGQGLSPNDDDGDDDDDPDRAASVSTDLSARSGQDTPLDAAEETSRPGFIDYAIALSESSENVAGVATLLGRATEEVGQKLESRTEQINKATTNLGSKAAPVLRSLMREVAKDFDSYSDEMEELNPQLRAALSQLGDSTNGVSRTRLINDPAARLQVENEIETLQRAEVTFGAAHASISEFANVIVNLPDMERNLTASGRRAYRAVAEAADIIDLGVSEFRRARLLLEERIAE
ncbi:hypothetical protein [Clavibacter michiganensis]|uniref:hypothetical protein n=1 Tax=Clavibacter michiganensis TaxID=28447 RepID=UPI0011B0A690|nr:hypothetical protein [Clavibacter michiganensis]